MTGAWTIEEIRLMRKCLKRQWSPGRIAAKIGRSRNAVLGKKWRIQRDGPSRPGYDRALMDEVIKLRDREGMTYREIGARINRSDQTARQIYLKGKARQEQPPPPPKPRRVDKDIPGLCKMPDCRGPAQPGRGYCASCISKMYVSRNRRAREWNGCDTRAGW